MRSADVRFRENSGHRRNFRECPLLTQLRHCPIDYCALRALHAGHRAWPRLIDALDDDAWGYATTLERRFEQKRVSFLALLTTS